MVQILMTLLVLVLPLGIAVQNAVSGLAILTLALTKLKSIKKVETSNNIKLLTLVAFLFLLTNCIASWVNSSNPGNEPISYFFGYLFWLLAPWLIIDHPLSKNLNIEKIIRILQWICMLWGIIAISQYFTGWHLSGDSLVIGEMRPRGFYSHPLSLAYVSILLYPLVLNRLIQNRGEWLNWGSAIGVGILCILTLSRTIQAGFLLITAWSIFVGLKGRTKWITVGIFVLSASIVAITDNSVSHKFKAMFDETGYDQSTVEYKDDRLVFWHAHWLMLQEKPVLGHGIHLGGDYRQPYYDRLNLENFDKTYAAHNQFLQILVNGGIVSLLWFVFWLWILFKDFNNFENKTLKLIAIQTLAIFLITGLTQNAFHDGEVRFTLIFMIIMISLLKKEES